MVRWIDKLITDVSSFLWVYLYNVTPPSESIEGDVCLERLLYHENFISVCPGVSFLNPIRGAIHANETTFPLDRGPQRGSTQNNALAMMGMPYVYNIHLSNITQVVAAANRAVRYRFSSHVPWEFQPKAMVSRVCTMLEDDALCICPNPIGGDGKRGIGNEDSDLDCSGSSVIRKNVN